MSTMQAPVKRAVATPTRGRHIPRMLQESWPAIATVIALIVAWQLIVDLGNVAEFIAPSPTAIAREFAADPGLLISNTWVTLLESLVGFGLGIAVGLPLAIMVVEWEVLRRTIYPVVLILQSVPKVALAPILLVWFGFGPGPKVLVAFLTCFFPIFLDAAAGMASTSPDQLDLLRSLRARRAQMLWRLKLPHALPRIFVGMEVGVTLAVIGAVVGEFVQSSNGLGYLILTGANQANTPLAFAALVLLTLISVVLFYVVQFVEHLVCPWAEHRRSRS